MQARSSGASTGDVLIDGAAAVPARGLVTRSRAASATDRPALRPACEELTALAPGRVLPFAPGDSRKRGPKLSQEVKALASAAAERREASAPEARCGGNVATAWRAPRPKRAQAVTSGRVARLVMRKAPVGAPPPFIFWRQSFRAVAWQSSGAKNAPREWGCSYLHPPPLRFVTRGRMKSALHARAKADSLSGESPSTGRLHRAAFRAAPRLAMQS